MNSIASKPSIFRYGTETPGLTVYRMHISGVEYYFLPYIHILSGVEHNISGLKKVTCECCAMWRDSSSAKSQVHGIACV